jgi:hypothetical protein
MDRPAMETGIGITLEMARSLAEKGYAIVPISPTPEMIDAGWAAATDENAEHVWRDMLEVALIQIK